MKSLLDTLPSDKMQISKNTLFSETPCTFCSVDKYIYMCAVNNPAGSRSMQYFTLLSPTMTLASQLCLGASRATCWLIHDKSVQNLFPSTIFTFISASVLRLIYLTFDRLWACLLLSWPRKQLLVHQLSFLRLTHKSIAAKCCKLAIWCFYRHHSLWVWLGVG